MIPPSYCAKPKPCAPTSLSLQALQNRMRRSDPIDPGRGAKSGTPPGQGYNYYSSFLTSSGNAGHPNPLPHESNLLYREQPVHSGCFRKGKPLDLSGFPAQAELRGCSPTGLSRENDSKLCDTEEPNTRPPGSPVPAFLAGATSTQRSARRWRPVRDPKSTPRLS